MNGRERRELEDKIVQMLSEGRRAAEIATEMELSPRTIEWRIGLMLGFYEAENSCHLVGIFFRDGRIE